MWAWCGTPSAWRAWTAAGRSWGPSSSRCTTGRRRCPPGSERASPIRSSLTASAAPGFPIPPARWEGGASTPAGRRSRSTAPTRTARCATGTSLAAIWPACGRSWATCGAWGWIPSTSAPSSRPRRTTATAPGTMRRSTPCWAPRPTSAPCAPTPTPWACGWCWTACSTTRALSAAISTATAPMRA